MVSTKTNLIVGAVFGGILVLYMVANTFSDASTELSYVNEEHKGGAVIKLIGLLMAVGVVYAIYKFYARYQ